VLLLGSTTPGYADDEEFCVPFRDSKVAPERVQAMLSAAEDGHLYRIQLSNSRMGFCIGSKFSRVEKIVARAGMTIRS
jgi:hypothetical protein